MITDEYFRIVRLRRGRLSESEFRLRPGERGLSVFANVGQPGPVEIVAAVRAAGKQGDLAAAIIPRRVVLGCRLRIVSTNGGTPNPEVNRLHAEIRLPGWRSLLLRLRGRSIDEYFNPRFSEQLRATARLVEREG